MVGVGAIALDLMMAVFVSSLLRTHIKPGAWRTIHWLAYASWPIALVHTFGLGTDAGEHWVIALGALCVLSVGAALVWRLHASNKRRAMLPSEIPDVAPLTRRVATANARGGLRDR